MKNPVANLLLSILLIIIGFLAVVMFFPQSQEPVISREVVQMNVAIDESTPQALNLAASTLPEFVFDLTSSKFQKLMSQTADQIKKSVEATIVHNVYANEILDAEIEVNSEKSKLIVRPEDTPNFKPGKYRLHLTLRTLEGDINVDQDFTWGVIAVNTDKSIYKPGDVATIGIGVLNDKGETQCATGKNAARVWLTVTEPNGAIKEYSTETGNIKDSGECGPISVTNQPDFVSIYLIKGPGTYNMKVTAEVEGKDRSIEDYFKVEADPAFDVKRTSFPTRIYPNAPYTVKFDVTPNEDYSGTIEEFVPTDFKISKISANGKDEIQGEFRKITWNADLKKGKTYSFTYTIQFPLVSPEFYLLGPIKIGGFREARQWQIASDAINSTTGVVAYEDNGGSNTFSRVWTGTAWNPAPPTAGDDMDPGADDAPDDSRWFAVKSSPKTGEKLVAAYDNCGAPINDQCIWMYRWTGSAWAEEDFYIDVDSASAPDMTDDTRIMDIEYEDVSGDALFVYSDDTNQLKYRRKPVGGSWDVSSSNAGTGMDSRKRWVKAKAKYGSDDILVGYLNDNSRIGAIIWNGTTNTFSNQFDDDDTPAQTEATGDDEEAFDIAWETQSGTPMMFWGTPANEIRYIEYSSGAWQSEAVLYDTGFTNDVEWVMASSDPRTTSNLIALAFQESDGDTVEETTACEFGVWDGSAAVTRPTEITCRSDYDGRLNAVQFEKGTGQAMWVYGISETGVTGNSMAWRTWNAIDGFSSSTTTTGDTGNLESIQLHSDLNTLSMIALYGDSNGDLWHREWDGNSWSALSANAIYTNIQNSGENAEAYGFGFDRNIETLVAYRWFNNANSTNVGSALTGGQDTPVILTTANPDIRLRILLYYPDTLAINGRTYNLQFIDPGSGSCENPGGDGTPADWTDVPTSGSYISFMNNGAVADADNLTANGNDPTYAGTIRNQDYEESNTFINSVAGFSGDEVGKWDFALHDNTIYDNTAQAFCFRVTRSNGIVLHVDKYPKIITAAQSDVIIYGGSLIQGGSELR